MRLTIAELEKELRSRKTELKSLYRRRRPIAARLAAIDSRMEKIGGAPMNGSNGANGHAPARDANGKTLLEMLEAVMKSGRAFTVGQIVAKVTRRGYRSKSANFRGIVNQTLIKEKRFRQVARGTYQMQKLAALFVAILLFASARASAAPPAAWPDPTFNLTIAGSAWHDGAWPGTWSDEDAAYLIGEPEPGFALYGSVNPLSDYSGEINLWDGYGSEYHATFDWPSFNMRDERGYEGFAGAAASIPEPAGLPLALAALFIRRRSR